MRRTPLRPTTRRHLARASLLLGIVAVQVLLILWLSEREDPLPAPASPQLTVVLSPSGFNWAADDPTLLALPSAAGFAGAGWRRATDPRYEPQDWDEPVQWLAADGQSLGRLLVEARPPGRARSSIAEKPTPALARMVLSAIPLPGGSTVRVEGELGRYPWLRAPAVPLITHSNVVGNTVIQVTVHPEGFVYSAIVLESCGLKTADHQALEVARAARFQLPTASQAETPAATGWRWGRLVFEWRTEAPESVAPPVGQPS